MNDYIVNVCGDSTNVSWLIKGDKNILYEAGMAYSAPKMIEKIKEELQGAPLDAVILSHSHYDHVAGLPFVKKEWPNAVVYGSEYAAKIISKPSVRETMFRLSTDAAKGAGMTMPTPYEEDLIAIDVTVKEGDVLTIGEHTIQVFETPGHTKCSVSYVIDQDVVLASETIGVFKGEWYMPCYLVGFQMCLDAVDKLRQVPAKRLFISHMGIQNDLNMEDTWEMLRGKLIETKEQILDIVKTHTDEDARLQAMKALYYDNVVSESEQPLFAFLLNAAASLKVIEREYMEENS